MLKFYITLMIFILFNQPVSGAEENNNISGMRRKTIAVDLDGVLNNYKEYKAGSMPEIRAGADDFIKELHKRGYKLILFTNRKPLEASKWLIENKIDMYFSDVTNVKPAASVYIDDRALKFNGDFNKTIEEINQFSVHWKK